MNSKHCKMNSKHWVKIIYDGVDDDSNKNMLFFENVSEDYIKGICCAFRNPMCSYDFDDNDNEIIIKSDLDLNGCLGSDGIASWQDRDYCEFYCGQYLNNDVDRIESNANISDRKAILNDPKKYNAKWKKFVTEHPENFIRIPTKRFYAIIEIDNIDQNDVFIVQFDSKDFIDGFELFRAQGDKHQYSLTILSIFKWGMICATSVEYKTPDNVEQQLSQIYKYINKYLPNDLARIVIDMYSKQCKSHRWSRHIYDKCFTSCVDSYCHVHKDSEEILELKDCIATVHLEPLT